MLASAAAPPSAASAAASASASAACNSGLSSPLPMAPASANSLVTSRFASRKSDITLSTLLRNGDVSIVAAGGVTGASFGVACMARVIALARISSRSALANSLAGIVWAAWNRASKSLPENLPALSMSRSVGGGGRRALQRFPLYAELHKYFLEKK